MIRNPDLAQPFAMWEEVEVSFPSSANTDVVVSHGLTPANPEHINYLPLRKSAAAEVYHDISITRKAWQPGYVLLRSNVASVKVRLLLYVSHAGSLTPSF